MPATVAVGVGVHVGVVVPARVGGVHVGVVVPARVGGVHAGVVVPATVGIGVGVHSKVLVVPAAVGYMRV